ncbi:hypothetical protein EYF80_041728 [Liparis tanakae]|uniref:Uncharacterized protein n=1 Tax=Liparis tanakae TaxID=230148 RepID=A0A4Z2G428_9TELE|nr:hypothetical protein EYF80_041728 [Liparis tanakae]
MELFLYGLLQDMFVTEVTRRPAGLTETRADFWLGGPCSGETAQQHATTVKESKRLHIYSPYPPSSPASLSLSLFQQRTIRGQELEL